MKANAEFQKFLARNPHLREYISKFEKETGETPEFHLKLEREMQTIRFPNIIYLAGEPVFVHIYRKKGEETRYYAIEPQLSKEEQKVYDKVFEQLLFLAQHAKEPKDTEELKSLIKTLLDEVVIVGERKEEKKKLRFNFSLVKKIPLNKKLYEALQYNLIKNIIGMGILEPLSRDPYIEDIFCSGLGPIFIVHKIFGALKTNIIIKSDLELDEYCYKLSEKIDRPLSDAVPIADGTLEDGSRVNIVYSRAISRRGSSFSIRKQVSEPLSIPKIVELGTISAEMAGYFWLAIEHGMNIFFCGESASGKTSLLNACCAFIHPKAKIYSCEDTIEVTVPHNCWQQLTTTTGGVREGGITMQDLLIASLRSRPNYIIVGEIRGAEGSIAFQAMQTGHPVMSTFHSSSVRKMIQRLTGNPINVPINFIDNLNIAVIMGNYYRKGLFVRRVSEVAEIEGYNKEVGGILTRTMFEWDPISDKHLFKGMFNSYILENKIANILGYSDKRQIYNDLALRARIIKEMVKRKIFDYYDVYEIIKSFNYDGINGLPFKLD
ncbi:MAG: hypothetical protein DRN95_00010 [Candidatus Hydrothermarchaeota archaeon]|nr:MAG: hypothetical protein DRN95_00010 [Candidatus Hydrothermarchaeota archaeon]